MNLHALIIDDEEAVCWALQRALKAEGYDTEVAATAEAGLRSVQERPSDVVFLDVRLPGMDGLTALRTMRELRPGLPVIVMTAYGDLSTAVQAMEGGAFDYLTKPFDLTQALRAAQRAQERLPVGPARNDVIEWQGDDLIGRSPAMQPVFKQIALVARHSASVLITGESGTGKELVARALHRHSQRSAGPFLTVHAAALNPGLVESELFGHVRGAFTGAESARTGLLALADGGTVFLDEVAEIPLAVQAKLLRALETGEVMAVGGDRPVHHDFRILAATHRDLQRLVDDGQFRHDLFFRLNVFRIHLPPLRERLDDLPDLAAHFLSRFAPACPPIPEETLAYLRRHPWPGNVREFRNALERAAILARGGPIVPEHFTEPLTNVEWGEGNLPAAVRNWLRQRMAGGAEVKDLSAELLNTVEAALYAEVIRRAAGNRSTAAAWLGLDRATVRKKLQQFGLAGGDPPSP